MAATTGEELQSFPSGHAIFFFALATTTYFFNKKYGWYLFLIATIMGVARVYVGMHWPLDIVLGALLGMVVGSAVYYYFSQYERVITRFVATFGR